MPERDLSQPIEVVKEIASRLSNPIHVKSIMLNPQNQNPDPIVAMPHWGDLSLSSGYPGILLLFTELERQFPSEGWENSIHEYVLAIKAVIEKEGLESRQQSLFGGLAGVCFSLRCASKEGARYNRMIEKLERILISGIEKYYLHPLKENLDKGLPSFTSFYEVMQGIAGICAYTIQYTEDSSLEIISRRMLEQLVRLTHSIQIEGRMVPGWYVLNEDLFLEEDRKRFTKGNFNLGVSHGIPGVLGILAIALMKGVEVDGHREAIQTIANWLLAKRHYDHDIYFWSGAISFEEEVGDVPLKKNSTRDAWCYGLPGIERMLFLAGKSIGNEVWKKSSLDSFERLFLSPHEQWHIPSPTFCHGLSGLYLITQHMHKDTFSPILQKEIAVLEKLILKDFNGTFPFGFRDLDLTKNGVAWQGDKVGLLEGSVGTLLSLLHPELSHPKWHTAFLIDAI